MSPENVDDRYPFMLDVEWLAIDRHGRVGVFTSGGLGPIPKLYLDMPESFDVVHEVVRAMPERTEAELLSRLALPNDFESFARRGCFAFDWSDVHRTSDYLERYELQARPRAPMTNDEVSWPPQLAAILEKLPSQALDFDRPLIDASELECERAR